MKKFVTVLATTTLLLAHAPAHAGDSLGAAAKLTALAIFVKESCVGLEPNTIMIGSAVRGMGVNPEELQKPARLRQVMLAYRVFNENPDAACTAAKRFYGPKGTNVPGLFDAE